MRYNFANEKHVLEKFNNMIKKVVPDFNDTKQYVLWLVCDFWENKLLYEVEGSVKLYDESDNEIDMQEYGLVGTKFLTRTPYYNKGIRQVGLKKSRDRIFGIPLIFDNYQDMMKIKTVKIHWDVIWPIFLDDKSEKAFTIRPTTVDIVYHVGFDVTNIEKNHWFTLSHQDKFFDRHKEGTEKVSDYYDVGMCVNNYHGWNDDGDFELTYDLCEIWGIDNQDRKLTDYEKEIVSMLDSQPFEHLIKMAKKHEEEGNAVASDEWDIDKYYYEKQITLAAEPYADIIPESGFGFK